MSSLTREGAEASVEAIDSGGRVVLCLTGQLATPDEVRLREAYARVASAGAKEVVLDFAAVEHISSSGISVLIDLLRESQESGGRLAFSGLMPHYAKVLTFMGLTQYVAIVDSPAAVGTASVGVTAKAQTN